MMMKSANCYKICPLVRIGPKKCTSMDNARAELLYLSCNLLFGDIFVAAPVMAS